MNWRRASWHLAERGPTRREELKRKVLRKWRRVPDLEALRRAGMNIGSNVAVMNGTHLDPGRPWLLTIGDDVTFSLDVVVLTHDASTLLYSGASRLSPVTIGSRVFFGAHSLVMPGVTIGDDVIVAAGAVVTRDVASGTVVAGVPAREISSLAEWREKHHRAMEVAPRWNSADLPTGYLPPAQREAARARIDEVGYGYVGHRTQPDQPVVGAEPVAGSSLPQ